MKPSDFLLGVLDFFAVLMPGAVMTWLAALYVSDLGTHLQVTGKDSGGAGALAWVLIFFSSYVLGHFVFMVGSILDGQYDRWRRWKHPKGSDRTYQAAKQVCESVSPGLSAGHFTTLKWAKAYVQVRSPAGRLEIDRFDATSKFFRSFVVVSFLLALHYGLGGHAGLAVGSLAVAVLSFWRYCDQRWKASELSYATASMLYSIDIPPEARVTMKEKSRARAVCYRTHGERLEFLLVLTSDGRRWTFPGGKIEDGETEAAAAAREAQEEAGAVGEMREKELQREKGEDGASLVTFLMRIGQGELRRAEDGRFPTWFDEDQASAVLRTGRAPEDRKKWLQTLAVAVRAIGNVSSAP